MLNKKDVERLLEMLYENMNNNRDDLDKPLDDDLRKKLIKEIKDM